MDSKRQADSLQDPGPKGEVPAGNDQAGPPESQKPLRRERRKDVRQTVDNSATILLVKIGSRRHGRIVDLSPNGCRIRTEENFPVGIYTRVEVEFCIDGLPFLLGGVTQAIHDRKTVGIRFLDMSPRKRQQVEELVHELAELHAEPPHVS